VSGTSYEVPSVAFSPRDRFGFLPFDTFPGLLHRVDLRAPIISNLGFQADLFPICLLYGKSVNTSA
jgi:hypothetical protein